jgi:hypothetical protein|tara:strand:- start:401 stop:598 length:198 start_codon:yes stop_codon:yes gene_type:complete
MNRLTNFLAATIAFFIVAFIFYGGWHIFFVEVFNLPEITYFQAIGFMLCCFPIRFLIKTVTKKNE